MSTLSESRWLNPIFECRVVGTPAPQGSKRHVGRGIMVESSKKLKPWRESVVYAATEATGGKAPRHDCPLELRLTFLLRRPKKPKSPHPDRTPDLSKLWRATEDALQDAGVISDDARICMAVVQKAYAKPDEQTGAVITLYAYGS